jgi:hypothetical protein
MTRAGSRQGEGRAALSALALIALLFQLAVPQGFMVAPTPGGPAIVICTGHGPLLASPDQPGAPAKAPSGKTAPICPFAGHGGAPTLAALAAPTPIHFEVAAETRADVVSVTPGRGLAAPPPPARAPPIRSV